MDCLQKGDLDNEHRGKAVNYCKAMLEANPQRMFAACLLTNMEELEVFELRRQEDGFELARSSPVSMLQGMIFGRSLGPTWSQILSLPYFVDDVNILGVV